jgi:hypothetical protein
MEQHRIQSPAEKREIMHLRANAHPISCGTNPPNDFTAMNLISPTATRVEVNTPDSVNREIENETLAELAKVMAMGPEGISRRLEELDREWDIERVLEANAAIVGLTGLTLGFTTSRKWFLLPMAVAGFLLQHALQGWCPPVPLLRKLGVRTASEINAERLALRVLSGDFGALADFPTDALRLAAADGADGLGELRIL